MIKACVIGFPIRHSRSPLIHGYWLRLHNIAGQYSRVEVHPSDLGEFLGLLETNGYVGCNVTVPHKENACKFVDVADERVLRTGALNTIYLRSGKRHATSTDGQGFIASIKWHLPKFEFTGKEVTLIGAGGSTRAIVGELLRHDVKNITLINRTVHKAEDIHNAFGARVLVGQIGRLPEILAGTDLLVNATSAGIADSQPLDLPLDDLKPTAVVADINYVPRRTPFLARAESRGFSIVPGLGMLLHQAVAGFELWFGVRPSVTQDLYDYIAADLDSTVHK